jgi:lipopolysaccharide heptosyltransferase II
VTPAKRYLVCVQGGHADGLRAVPFVRALRIAQPDAHIAVLAYGFVSELWAYCPYVDDFVASGDDAVLGKGWASRLEKIGRIAGLLPRTFRRYDVFLNLEVQAEGGFPGVLAAASAIPVRIGHGGARRGMNRSPGPADMRVPYEDRMRELMGVLGIDVTDARLEAWCRDEDRRDVREMLAAAGWHPGRRVVVCHSGSDWSCQTWAPAAWVSVARSLIQRHDVMVVFAGVTAEAGQVEAIARRCGTGSTSLCGRTSFRQLCALLEMAELVICGDTVVAPLALAMGASPITLMAYDTSNWGPSRLRELNALAHFEVGEPLPWSVRCHWNRIGRVHGCISESCVGVHGMGRVKPREVLELADRIIATSVAQLEVARS